MLQHLHHVERGKMTLHFYCGTIPVAFLRPIQTFSPIQPHSYEPEYLLQLSIK